MTVSSQVALVTGAGTGMGEATARLLASRGAAVALVGRRPEKVGAVADSILADGGRAVPIAADVADPAQVEAAVAKTVSEFGAVHHLVNNAGVAGTFKPLADISPEDWRHVLDINLSGLFYGIKFAAPAIVSAGGGAIVNVSSVFADRGGNSPEYVAAKHGIRGLTRAAAVEYGPLGVRVNELQPGVIWTDMTMADRDGTQRVAERGIPLGRIGEANEIATVVAFLLSPEASYVSGAHLAVDGGFLA